MNNMKILLISFLVVFITSPLWILWVAIKSNHKKAKKLREEIIALANGYKAITPAEFFDIREHFKGCLYAFDFMGCYILCNKTKNKYYVGQATHVPNRINAHLTGRGNGDVYADFRAGDLFEVRMIDITTTSYKRLNDLERNLIWAYNAYSNGYNKTRGNK